MLIKWFSIGDWICVSQSIVLAKVIVRSGENFHLFIHFWYKNNLGVIFSATCSKGMNKMRKKLNTTILDALEASKVWVIYNVVGNVDMFFTVQ